MANNDILKYFSRADTTTVRAHSQKDNTKADSDDEKSLASLASKLHPCQWIRKQEHRQEHRQEHQQGSKGKVIRGIKKKKNISKASRVVVTGSVSNNTIPTQKSKEHDTEWWPPVRVGSPVESLAAGMRAMYSNIRSERDSTVKRIQF